LLFAAAFNAHADTRVALVIGNGTYQHAPLLPNAAHDATDVAAALRKLGYSVQLVMDARKAGKEAALAEFALAAKGADQVLLYYSGHGLEVGGINYLVPVDASIESEATVPLEAVQLPTVMGIASSARRLELVVRDACRNNPLANKMHRANGTRGAFRSRRPAVHGSAEVAPPRGGPGTHRGSERSGERLYEIEQSHGSAEVVSSGGQAGGSGRTNSASTTG
jgi:hypothetical protein